MANVKPYPDLTLNDFTSLDPIEDARDFPDIVVKNIAHSLDHCLVLSSQDQTIIEMHLLKDREHFLAQF